MPYHESLKLVFIHVPKCGGTSIEDALDMRKAHRLHINYNQNRKLIADYKAAPQHWPASRVRLWIGESAWREATKFAIIREPLARFISAYKWRRRDGLNLLQLAQFVEREIMPDAANGFENVIEKHANKAMFVTHLLPQLYFLDEESIKCIKLENISVEWPQFADGCEAVIPRKLPRQNASRRVLTAADQADLPQVKTIIRRIYAEDYARFYPDHA